MFFGFARSPIRLIVLLAVAYGFAHFVLAPAHVKPSGQIAITVIATFFGGLIWEIAAASRRNARRREQEARDDPAD